MQQTETYKLNLIESSDPFLPEGLNENTQKIEEVLKGMEDGPLAEMDGRVAALEAHRFVVGTYTGTGESPGFINLGFTPVAVLVYNQSPNYPLFACAGAKTNDGFLIVENGFLAGQCTSVHINQKNYVYPFLAFI